MSIHPLAAVSPLARLAEDVEVHPFCVIEPEVSIGSGCILEPGVVIKRGTVLGRNNHVFEGTVLGGLPQHLRMPSEVGQLVIGDGNTIRENVTVHRALEKGHETRVGNQNLIMVGVHIAHDCTIGNHTILANNVMLAGHIQVDDRAYLSGLVGVHQFCRIGAYAMVGGQAHVVKDVAPYVTIDGATTLVVGLNQVGLRRNGFTREQIDELKAAYRLIFRSNLKWDEMLRQLEAGFASGPATRFLEFFRGGKRGFTLERRIPRGATIRLPDSLAAGNDEAELKAKAG